MPAYYNEIDPAACAVLRELIARGVIAPGDVDDRSIKDVQPADLDGYAQHHFFAGGGLWSVAARLAGWPDDRAIWTASCPCQGESLAGKRLGADDPRHLWPDLHRLIRARRPAVVVGEQVAAAAGTHWLDGVCADLDAEGYAARAVDIPACAVDAPHQRQRLYWVACVQPDADRGRRAGRSQASQRSAQERAVVEWTDGGLQPDAGCDLRRGGPGVAIDRKVGSNAHGRNGSWWFGSEWIVSHLDGKARRAKPCLPFLVDGLPGRVDLWRIGGNAISPILAAEVIAALKETIDG